jgi:hypothetical protein
LSPTAALTIISPPYTHVGLVDRKAVSFNGEAQMQGNPFLVEIKKLRSFLPGMRSTFNFPVSTNSSKDKSTEKSVMNTKRERGCDKGDLFLLLRLQIQFTSRCISRCKNFGTLFAYNY